MQQAINGDMQRCWQAPLLHHSLSAILAAFDIGSEFDILLAAGLFVGSELIVLASD